MLRYAEFLKFQKENPFLPYIKIVPERFALTRPNYLCFVSTPTIDIEPIFYYKLIELPSVASVSGMFGTLMADFWVNPTIPPR